MKEIPPALADLTACAGGDSSGEGVAPRALCVHRVRGRTGQSQLLREGRTAVLRAGLLHPVLPSLCALQQTHTKCERLMLLLRNCVKLLLKSSDQYPDPPKAF